MAEFMFYLLVSFGGTWSWPVPRPSVEVFRDKRHACAEMLKEPDWKYSFLEIRLSTGAFISETDCDGVLRYESIE